MNAVQIFVTIAMMALGTVMTRFIAFICFPAHKETPAYVLYLGKVLPYAVMGLLIIYCLKNCSVMSSPYGLPEGIAIALTAVLHLFKRNTMLSISAGTVLYMILIQFVFHC